MKQTRVSGFDRFGLVRSSVDAHTLGLVAVAELLEECRCQYIMADNEICSAFNDPADPACLDRIVVWLKMNQIAILGYSYRLDPRDGVERLARLVHGLKERRVLESLGGTLKAVYFAGLPEACDLAKRRVPELAGTFSGDETPRETLEKLGIDPGRLPGSVAEGVAYDEARLAFGRELVKKGEHLSVRPVVRSGYAAFGTSRDMLMDRIRHGTLNHLPPLMRSHAGPYLADRGEAVKLFMDWTRQLAAAGFLDVLSIGSSQLTQTNFEEDWGGRPNGGGVPINSRSELAEVWQAARPMLVRTYAGARNVREMAEIHEKTINIAWHAFSLWWFGKIDGRGPNTVMENLRQHVEAIKYAAVTGKPCEPNVSHHFGFRGSDDVSYVVSAVLAARMARKLGIRHLVLQNMLNTPKSTWGVQDLAKSRVMLRLVRELEDDGFSVVLQPRGGLDYFSSDPEKAKAQIAAVTALMDDIEPADPASPQVIHVVSYLEARELAGPSVINESIQITRCALEKYRSLRASGLVPDMSRHPDVLARTEELLSEVRTVLRAIESAIPDPYCPEGLYRVLAMGFLPLPHLLNCREEFVHAAGWRTRSILGSVKVVNAAGVPIPVAQRVREVAATSGNMSA
ncbi:MAG: cobalamin-binding protein [Verrucomicrobia bacterium]|nr:cobalamin-binding protein [Verrucomicrobiota bacterium]